MAKVFFNQDFNNWSASNGATRRTLKIVSKLTTINEDLSMPVICNLGTLDKGNHSFIFVNEGQKDNRILGVFLNTSYGYSVHSGKNYIQIVLLVDMEILNQNLEFMKLVQF